jgi:hypothetical protein
MLSMLEFCLPPRHSCLHSHDHIDMWTSLSICCICQPEVEESSVLEHWALNHVLTLMLGKMLDVARHGPCGGKLSLWCQHSYIWLTAITQYLLFDCHFTRNCNGDLVLWRDSYCTFHVRSRLCDWTNICRWPFRWRISFLSVLNMRYQQSFTSKYPCKQTNTSHRTDLLQIAIPLESPATCSDRQQNISWVEPAQWHPFIPLQLVACYVFLRTFHILLSSS